MRTLKAYGLTIIATLYGVGCELFSFLHLTHLEGETHCTQTILLFCYNYHSYKVYKVVSQI